MGREDNSLCTDHLQDAFFLSSAAGPEIQDELSPNPTLPRVIAPSLKGAPA